MKFLRRAAHIVSILALASWSLQAQQQPAKTGNQSANLQPGQPSTQAITVTASPVINLPASNSDEQSKNSATDAASNRVIAGATAIIAVFTVALWYVGCKQWQAIKEQNGHIEGQLKATRDAIILTHRPRIQVRNIVSDSVATACRTRDAREVLRELTGTFHVVNSGGTTATIQSMDAIFAIVDEKKLIPMERPYDNGIPGPKPDIQPLLSGMSAELHFVPKRITPDEFSQLHGTAKRADVLAMGLIVYTDEAGHARQSAFCARFVRDSERFVREGGEDYNYDD